MAELCPLARGSNERIRETLAVRALKPRFGQPNGFQNFRRKDDSDTSCTGFSAKRGECRRLHLRPSPRSSFDCRGELTDQERGSGAIKADFSRVAKEKSAIFKSFEEYILFQNKYARDS